MNAYFDPVSLLPLRSSHTPDLFSYPHIHKAVSHTVFLSTNLIQSPLPSFQTSWNPKSPCEVAPQCSHPLFPFALSPYNVVPIQLPYILLYPSPPDKVSLRAISAPHTGPRHSPRGLCQVPGEHVYFPSYRMRNTSKALNGSAHLCRSAPDHLQPLD